MKKYMFILSSPFIPDEDLSGDHLLAETTQPLQKLLQSQTQKKLHLNLERPNLKVRPGIG
jgi:hypothetical protein